MPLVIELVGLFDHAVQTIVDASGGVVDRVDSAVPRFARADVRFRAKLGVGGAMIFECIGDYREFPPLVAPRRRVVLRGYVSLSAKYPRTDRSRRERSTVSKLLHWIPGRQRTIWHIAILDKCIKTRSRSQPIFLCHALRFQMSRWFVNTGTTIGMLDGLVKPRERDITCVGTRCGSEFLILARFPSQRRRRGSMVEL